jgi:hypothetical protein
LLACIARTTVALARLNLLTGPGGGNMSMYVENQSLEAEIAECCQALYWAMEPDIAMKSWARLRELTARKADEETRLFLLESRNRRRATEAA